MDYKESLIWGNQFLTQINASLSRSVNETPGLYPPPRSPLRAAVYANADKHCIQQNESRLDSQSWAGNASLYFFEFQRY